MKDSPYKHLDITDRPNALPLDEQTKWAAGIFPIPTSNDIRYFNCSLIRRNDGLWLFARRARNIKGDWMGMNDVVALKLRELTNTVQGMIDVQFPKVYKGEHFEDPRVMWMGGSIWISCTTFIPRMFHGAHQRLCRLDERFAASRPISPVYGGNGASPLMQAQNHEKNWLWFEHDGKPHMVYRHTPHQVVEWPDFFEFRNPVVHDSRFTNPRWCHGEPRGGTPPVRVGDEYWSFFHSSLPWRPPKRQYFMGAYAFEAKPPFRITRMSLRPLLAGSIADPWAEGLPLVVFPCGAVLEDGRWIVTMGINDYRCGWIEIPHKELEQQTDYVEPF